MNEALASYLPYFGAALAGAVPSFFMGLWAAARRRPARHQAAPATLRRIRIDIEA